MIRAGRRRHRQFRVLTTKAPRGRLVDSCVTSAKLGSNTSRLGFQAVPRPVGGVTGQQSTCRRCPLSPDEGGLRSNEPGCGGWPWLALGPRQSAWPVHALNDTSGAHRRHSCRVRVSQLRGPGYRPVHPGADRLREPAAAGGRASVSEGSDAAGSDLGARLPVGAPCDSIEGVRCREVTARPPLMVAVAASAGKMDFETALSCGASPRSFPLKFLSLRPCVGLA